jgi:signal transduction histidine kinase
VYNSETFGSINALTALYEADHRERQIALLAAERDIDSLKLLKRAREIERNRLLLAQRREEHELLTRERRLQQLALERAADSLRLHENSIAMERARSVRQKHRLDLQAAALGQQQLERSALIAGCVVLAVFAVLLVRNLRNRRRLLVLRAESSELHAKAIEAQAAAQSAELERREHQQRRKFTGRLLGSQEQERKRIAGALHDGIGQDLLIIKHRAMMALEDTGQEQEYIGDIMHITVEAVEDVRRLCRDLRPYQLERVGLTATLRGMLESIDGSSEMELLTDIGELDGLLAPEREIDLYRVLQEGMNNILKHAKARHVSVRVQSTDNSIELSLQDDGCGFDPEMQRQRVDAAGMGLLDMSERIHLLGGSIVISSAVGKGTTIEASIPLITVSGAEISSNIEQETAV